MKNKLLRNKPFVLCANCIPVKGSERSVICDLGRAAYDIIPNALFHILMDKEIGTINDALKKYAQHNAENTSMIEDYFAFLLEKDYLFFTDHPDFYPAMDLSWDYPAEITNCLVDVNAVDMNDITSLFSQLEELGCTNIQFRCYAHVDIEIFKDIFSKIKYSIIDSLEIIMPFQYSMHIEDWETFVKEEYRVKFIQFYGAPKYDTVVEGIDGRGFLLFVEDFIDSQKCCGVISPFYFVSNMRAFTEAQKHNTCLNRKISIDTEGYIRNCPSMPEHYGNIKDTTLREAMRHPDFKKYWFINKDQIEVCKDCEFRYICTDCRAYRENPEDLYSKPLKCGYNPYTAEWEEWSTNPLKQKAIDHYGMRSLQL